MYVNIKSIINSEKNEIELIKSQNTNEKIKPTILTLSKLNNLSKNLKIKKISICEI